MEVYVGLIASIGAWQEYISEVQLVKENHVLKASLFGRKPKSKSCNHSLGGSSLLILCKPFVSVAVLWLLLCQVKVHARMCLHVFGSLGKGSN